MNDPIHEYYAAICDGTVTVGKWIQLLYKWLIELINNGKVIYSPKKANHAIRFIETFCHHHKGRNDTLTLELWQKALIAAIFGVLDKDKYRHFREVFIVIARKNGKSLLAAAIIAYCLYADGEFGPEIYCVAPKLDQAEIVYSAFWSTVQAEPDLEQITKHRKSDLYVAECNGIVKKIAFNSRRADGYNPSLTVMDEIAAWPGEQGLKQYEVMQSGTGSRRQPLTLSITTAGYEDGGIYDELMARATRVLMGDAEEFRFLPVLYMIDELEKWDDMEELKKANPNLGVSVSVEFLEAEIAVAHGSLSKRAEFIVKYCCIKQNSSVAWLPANVVELARGPALHLEDFARHYAVGGIDLSKTTDLTACCIIIEKDGKLFVFVQFFLPKNKIDEASARDHLPYRLYMERGLLKASGENHVDYKDCFAWFLSLRDEYEIATLEIGYDRYSAQYLIQDMKQEGFHMDDVFQGFNLSPVIHEMEGHMRDGIVQIGDNDLLAIHLLNSATKTDTETGRKRLVKIKSTAHIDGAAALLDALTVRQKWWAEIGQELRNVR